MLAKLITSGKLSEEEEQALIRELADAYHLDEATAASRQVERMAEKIRARIVTAKGEPGGEQAK